MSSPSTPMRTLVLLAAALFGAGTASAADATASEQQQIDALQRQLQAVQSQLLQLVEQNKLLLQKLQQVEPLTGQAAVPAMTTASPVPSNGGAAFSNVRLWGYGESAKSRRGD